VRPLFDFPNLLRRRSLVPAVFIFPAPNYPAPLAVSLLFPRGRRLELYPEDILVGSRPTSEDAFTIIKQLIDRFYTVTRQLDDAMTTAQTVALRIYIPLHFEDRPHGGVYWLLSRSASCR